MNPFLTIAGQSYEEGQNSELRKAEDRAHIIEGLLRALDAIDEINKDEIRGSDNAATARNSRSLIEALDFTEIQAQAMKQRLQRLTES